MATKTYEYTTTPKDSITRKMLITADETDTTWTLTNVKISVQKGSYEDLFVLLKINDREVLDVDGTPAECGFVSDGNYWSRTITYSLSTTKSKTTTYTHKFYAAIQPKNLSVSFMKPVTVPKQTSYAVTYIANGGTGEPDTQTKWYGESLTLSSSTPTRAGYKFDYWSTNSSGGGTTYAPGAIYTANAALTLYAHWKTAAQPPTISSMSVIRCDSSGNQADEGTYCKVTASWRVDTTSAGLSGNQGVVTGNIKGTGSSTRSITFSSGTSGTSGTAVALIDSCDIDVQYVVTVTVTNSKIGTGQSSALATSRGDILTKATFVMDFKSGGKGIGIGVAAPSSGLEVGWAATFDKTLKVTGEMTAVNYTKSTDKVNANVVSSANTTYWTVQAAKGYKIGMLAQVYLQTQTRAALTAGTEYRVCYLTNKYRAIDQVNTAHDKGALRISNDGVYFTPRVSIASGTGINFGFVYMSSNYASTSS